LPRTPNPMSPLCEARVKPQTFVPRTKSKSSCMSFEMNGQGRDKIVTIDCGGIVFRTFALTLQKIPKSRLSNLVDSESPLMQTGYIFFDRNPIIFAAILEYFRCDVMAAVFVRVCLSMCRPISARLLYDSSLCRASCATYHGTYDSSLCTRISCHISQD
jgi:hypothetical protein